MAIRATLSLSTWLHREGTKAERGLLAHSHPQLGSGQLTFEPKKADNVTVTKGVKSGVPGPPLVG